MEAASKIDLGKLVLGHFSSRYSAKEIDAAIAKYKQQFGITIPVVRVLPGEIARGI
jgi:ribonuclease Z